MAAEVRRALQEPALRRHPGRVSPDGPARPPGGRPAHRALTLHEVQYANAARAFEKAGNPWTRVRRWYDWMVQLNYEVRSCSRFDAVVCMTGEDARLLSRVRPRLQAADHPHRGRQPLLPGRAGCRRRSGARQEAALRGQLPPPAQPGVGLRHGRAGAAGRAAPGSGSRVLGGGRQYRRCWIGSG